MFDSDNSNIATSFDGEAYGGKIQLSNSFGNTEDYEFAFWVVNGAVREDLPIDHEFVVTDAMDIQAVFSPTSSHGNGLKHASVFMDSNGQVIDTQYVADKGDAVDPRNQADDDPETYTETFDNYPETGTAYNAGSFSDSNNLDITWNYVESNAAGKDMIDGKAVSMDKDGDGSELSATMTGGIDALSIDYVDTHSKGAGVEIFINGASLGSSSETSNDTIDTFTLSDLDVRGDFDLKIVPTNGQTTVDNFEWTTNPGIALPDKP
ncbi:MAG: hypothetical protein ACLFUQ_07395, partial [Candidatus Izemoplasmataceae bacterium]